MSLQKAAEQKFGIKPKIKAGKLGDLSVFVNGKSVFNYKTEGQMPATDALLSLIEAARS